MAELVELYDDWPLGGIDASLIAIAERLSDRALRRHRFGQSRDSLGVSDQQLAGI
jgi:hypothetical protein